MAPNLASIKVISFDCYGTLIDWESGILSAVKPMLTDVGIELGNDEILQRFARFESTAQKGDYINYRSVLRKVVDEFGRELHFTPNAAQRRCLEESLPRWRPFPDVVEALRRLKERCRLVILSNIDDDLFAGTAAQLEVTFDQVITAEQVGSYKPALNNFRELIRRTGMAPGLILHVGASLYHDIVPARQVGLTAVYVSRRGGRPGFGATVSAAADPDLEVVDLVELASLVSQTVHSW